MTLPEQIKEQYRLYGQEINFVKDLELLLQGGWVYSDPTLFAAARPVMRDAPPAQIIDPLYLFHRYDCWHVHWVAGCIQKAFTILPTRTRWISYQRRGRLRIHELNTIEKFFDESKPPAIPPGYAPV